MSYKIIFATILLGFSVSIKSSAKISTVTLSDSARVSLLTCSQGDELYSIFGHSGIRVTDPQHGIDWVFNYGTFNFGDPNFYSKFVRGKLDYILSVSNYKNFELTYIYEKRYIYEQELNLNQLEKQLLIDSLQINYLPENRYYSYDFLFDNCATRIRDIFVEAIPASFIFNNDAIEQGKTFRQLLKPYVIEKPWAKLGINLLLGVKADRQAEPWEYMFLPEHMMNAFKHASIRREEDKSVFAKEPIVILVGEKIPKNIFRNSPIFVFSMVLALALLLTFYDIQKRRVSKWFDIMLFTIVGLVGSIIAFQWFGSEHVVMSNNYNLIWAHPLQLIAGILLAFPSAKKIVKYYFGLNFFALLLLLLFWALLPQSLPWATFPLVVTMAIRSMFIFKHLNGLNLN